MAPRRENLKLPACGFIVNLNAKDESLPIKIKKVAKGKKVTILSGITGSRSSAVNTLKQLMGVGGEVSEEHPNAIELQGDQSGRLLTTLRNLGALRGETAPSESVLKTNHGYEDFMKKKNESKVETFPVQPEEMSQACILVHGRYWPYCSGACVFCPPLTDVFEGLDMFCAWYEPSWEAKPKSPREDIIKMTDEEIFSAFSSLGMKAEVGEACRDYERQKRLRVSIPFVMKQQPDIRTVSPPPVLRPLVRKPVKKREFVDRPVRVILNRSQPDEERDNFFILEVSLVDPSQWMSDYEHFIVSLLRETLVDLANHELEDSKTLRLFFYDRVSMEECETVLNEVMPNFFELRKTDAISPFEAVPRGEAETIVEYENESDVDFESLAREFGVDNETFWEHFTLLIEKSDGSAEGLMHAFQAALLEVTK